MNLDELTKEAEELEIKGLRETIRRHKKEKQRLAQNIIVVNQREKIFQSRDWSTASRSIFLQEKYLLTKQKTLIEVEKDWELMSELDKDEFIHKKNCSRIVIWITLC